MTTINLSSFEKMKELGGKEATREVESERHQMADEGGYGDEDKSMILSMTLLISFIYLQTGGLMGL